MPTLDEKINDLETQLATLRAQKEEREDHRNDKKYAPTYEKFKVQYLELQKKYCSEPEKFTLSFTVEFEIVNSLDPENAKSYIENITLIDSDNEELAESFVTNMSHDDYVLEDMLASSDRPFIKESDKFLGALGKSKYSNEIADDLYGLESFVDE